ncbi:MAG: OPT family oligopeptide transporter [Candidatus Kapaibacterium sp.]
MAEENFVPYVPESETGMAELTMRALILGIIMAVVLGAANAYLGLKAGMTIAATYPAAVIGMAFLKIFKGSILEENLARTIGSVGESVAAGAIFTIPAFMIAGIWSGEDFGNTSNWFETSIILLVGGFIGILFVTIMRRMMVTDKELPFPESIAAAEIHKAGRSGTSGAKFLFWAMGLGALIQILIKLQFFAKGWEYFVEFKGQIIAFTRGESVTAGGGALLSSPAVSPAYMGVGYIIGPQLASLSFAGGLLAWGLFVPLLLYFLGPELTTGIAERNEAGNEEWAAIAGAVWASIVRPIAIGGMLLAAAHTIWKMRKNLAAGLSRAFGDVRKKGTSPSETEIRTQKDLDFKWVLIGVAVAAVATFLVTNFFTNDISASIVATIVMVIAAFFFSAVAGYLVGLIGSSNNPISGLTISTLIVAAVLMVLLGMSGNEGIAAVLGVAAIIAVAAAVSGDMFQDLKVGYLLGGTPWKMQLGEMAGVLISAFVMFFPLVILHQGDIIANDGEFILGVTGLGGENYPAPQASLMAVLAKGIVGGSMPWPLIFIGFAMSMVFILLKVKSPMLVCVGMYLPLETSFAIFIGGLIKGILDKIIQRRKFNSAQKSRLTNNGVLLASGLIAGEALIGLLFAALAVMDIKISQFFIFEEPSFLLSLLVFAVIGYILIRIPVNNAGSPDEPAPPPQL